MLIVTFPSSSRHTTGATTGDMLTTRRLDNLSGFCTVGPPIASIGGSISTPVLMLTAPDSSLQQVSTSGTSFVHAPSVSTDNPVDSRGRAVLTQGLHELRHDSWHWVRFSCSPNRLIASVAIYARYSSDNQRDALIADHAALYREPLTTGSNAFMTFPRLAEADRNTTSMTSSGEAASKYHAPHDHTYGQHRLRTTAPIPVLWTVKVWRLRRGIHHGRPQSPRMLRCPRKGTCDNRLTIRRDEVEARVLKALQEKLLRQDLFDEFCEEFTREMNRLRMEHRASLSAAEREIERIEARRKKLIEMVMDGVAPSVVKDELNANAARREQLEAKLLATEEPPPLLHPEMARIYRTKVRELAKALQQPDSRSEATEALRGLVDAIVLTPDEASKTLQIELRGNLAAMLGATVQTKRSPESDDLSLQVSLVAGAGFEPATFGL